jgi:hypothetical protein
LTLQPLARIDRDELGGQPIGVYVRGGLIYVTCWRYAPYSAGGPVRYATLWRLTGQSSFEKIRDGGEFRCRGDQVAIQGDYAYVTTSERVSAGDGALLIFHFNQFGYPVLISRVSIRHAITVAVSGRYAYVGTLRGLCVVSVSDPLKPFVIAWTPWHPVNWANSFPSIVVHHGYVYVARGGYDVGVIDINNLAEPRHLRFYRVGGHTNYVALIKNHVLVASDDNGLSVLDMGHSHHPIRVGIHRSNGHVSQIAVAKNYAAYAAANQVFAVDISRPTKPDAIGHFAVTSPVMKDLRDAPRIAALATDGTRLYVAGGNIATECVYALGLE